MSTGLKVLGLLVGVGVGVLLVWGLGGGGKEDEKPPAPVAPKGPCAVKAGYARKGKTVTWNPISAAGRCAPTATRLVVDNGMKEVVVLVLGVNILQVGSGEHVTVVMPPGPFELKATTLEAGRVLDEGSLVLAEGHSYLYNPRLAYDYQVQTKSYGVVATGGADRRLAVAAIFDPGPIDFMLEPAPDKVSVPQSTDLLNPAPVVVATRTVLVHHLSDRVAPAVRKGDLWTIAVSPTHQVVFSGRPTLDAGLGTVFVDNSDPRAPLPVAVDGVALADAPPGGTLRVDLPAGSHRFDAGEPTSIELATGDRWVWNPQRRREYRMETIQYGMPVAGQPPPIKYAARGLPAFRVTADYVFEPPETVDGFLGRSVTILRRGRVSASRVTKNDCDLLVARGRTAEAAAWSCTPAPGAPPPPAK